MKAYEILMFMMGFNLVLNLVLIIVGGATPPGAEVEITTGISGETVVGSDTIMALALAISAASVTVLGTRVIRPIGVVVTSFAGFYGYMLYQAMAVLYNFRFGDVNLIPIEFIVILTAYNVIVFLAAIHQMVTGGWGSSN